MSVPISPEVQAFRGGIEEILAAQVAAAEADRASWVNDDKIAKVGNGLIVFTTDPGENSPLVTNVHFPLDRSTWGIATEERISFPDCDVAGRFGVISLDGPIGSEFIKVWKFPPRPGESYGANVSLSNADPDEKYLQLLRDPQIDSPLFVALSQLDPSAIPHIMQFSGPPKTPGAAS